MLKIVKQIVGLVVVVVVSIGITFYLSGNIKAEEGLVAYGEGGKLEQVEVYVEIVNVIIALIVIGVSATGLKKVGGTIRKAWLWVFVATIFFGILEMLGALKGLEVFTYAGLTEVVELFAVISLFFAVSSLKKLF